MLRISYSNSSLKSSSTSSSSNSSSPTPIRKFNSASTNVRLPNLVCSSSFYRNSSSTSSPRTVTPNKRFDPKSIQKVVLEWCQNQTKNYNNVDIRNFSSSWADGLAFCALIHSFMPDSFDFNKLVSQNRRQNFELAFDVAYKRANIMPLLEVGDMLKMGNRPDDRCVFTYVSTIYSRFARLSSTPSTPSSICSNQLNGHLQANKET